ncbi:putative FMN-binding split barrel [Senna tora]|uniref:Putative FMN-binding split barrel n=1 Tax=Senna tora TaxID=362788 RepID=A0A834TQG8_9FABA|nr:putative FMN-binding split barrel [Senna tora]
MKPYKTTVLTFAEKCKNILASNWQGHLNTIKSDAKGSKGSIHTSKVKYMLKRGKPYVWVPENDLHNVNAIIDERGSFAVTTPFPGPLGSLLKSMKKLPARVALAGDVLPLQEDKAMSLAEKLEQVIRSEQRAINEFSYVVSGVLNDSSLSCRTRSDNLQELLGDKERYSVYKFEISSCTYIDDCGGTFEVDVEEMVTSKADQLAPFSAKLIDGINQREVRRRALMLFCFVYMNVTVKDALVTSIDRKGFDVLGKVPGPVSKDGVGHYQWKEFRFMFKEEANNVETFCRQLVEMEEEALQEVSSYSGLKIK